MRQAITLAVALLAACQVERSDHLYQLEHDILLLQASPLAVDATYESDKVGEITMTAVAEASAVETEVTFEDLAFTISARLPNAMDEGAEYVRRSIDEKASAISSTTDLKLVLEEYNAAHKALLDATAHLTNERIHYAFYYHREVLERASRLSAVPTDAPADCTNPAGRHCRGESPTSYQTEPDAQSRLFPSCGGSSLGCCGNYSGFCWYSSVDCLAHDFYCWDCDSNICGPGCVPESGSIEDANICPV